MPTPWKTERVNIGVHSWESSYLAKVLCQSCNWLDGIERGLGFSNKLTWLGICLDGADRRREAGHPRRDTDQAENMFLDVVEQCISSLESPLVRLFPSFRDGIILAYAYESRTRTLCYDIARELRRLNQDISNWEWEYHIRGSTGSTLSKMISGLPCASRDKLWFPSSNANSYEGTAISL